ncbi:MAG: STAS domain-containing protein [Saccharofermentans sp.]|jgi:anti-sigma B factor antagonist|nr:STAS domain-containing protein [Clostridiales bacterium]MBR4493526.1 STAS domain-containing protein [Clostridiales bacterium]MCR5047894.1 STAS domain-containing protein [Saccharofermentans sp.]
MEFKTTKEDTKLTVAIEGRLDTLSAPDLEKGLEPELAGITDLVLDLKDLEYISSAGLRVLLGLAQVMEKQGDMKVINPGDAVMDVFSVTGFDDILNIE